MERTPHAGFAEVIRNLRVASRAQCRIYVVVRRTRYGTRRRRHRRLGVRPLCQDAGSHHDRRDRKLRPPATRCSAHGSDCRIGGPGAARRRSYPRAMPEERASQSMSHQGPAPWVGQSLNSNTGPYRSETECESSNLMTAMDFLRLTVQPITLAFPAQLARTNWDPGDSSEGRIVPSCRYLRRHGHRGCIRRRGRRHRGSQQDRR